MPSAKKSVKRTSSKHHPSGKRDLVCHSNGKGAKKQCWYVKRQSDGSFKTMAKVSRSQVDDKAKNC